MELMGLDRGTSEASFRQGKGVEPFFEAAFWTLSMAADRDDRPILIKRAKGNMPRTEEIQFFNNDFAMSLRLAASSGRMQKAIELHTEVEPVYMILDAGAGTVLESLLGAPLPLDVFLEYALEIARGVQDLHDAGVTHHLLSPQSIFVELGPSGDAGELKALKLGNFGGATTSDAPGSAWWTSPAGSDFAYISPEQTGRMNRLVDYRTDFYSMGVIFYRMLAGSLPISGTDALGWFHAHMTVVPLLVSSTRRDVPFAVSEMIAKLLRKMPDERYQSALGIIKDLERCREELAAKGRISAFSPGREDRVPVFRPPKKLYGRGQDLEKLAKRFSEAAAGGPAGFVLIRGYSGIGKSSLVQELGGLVTRKHGRFIAGKFDQQNRNAPYFTFTQALRELVLGMVASGEEKSRAWREKLKKGLGPSASVLFSVVPEISLLLGPVLAMPLEEPAPEEAEWRLLRAVHGFFELVATPEHPLVIFLDDLQWSDDATLKLFESLALSAELKHLLFIGSYRENEVGAAHRLAQTVEKLRLSGRLTELALGPLTERDVRLMIAETLQENESTIAPLASLIFTKTAGNPFFVLQFLRSIISERLLRFDGRSGRWVWEVARIEAAGYTESALELMVKMLEKLPPPIRETLKVAALIGSRFRAKTLSRVTGVGLEAVEAALRPAVMERLIYRTKDGYGFQHDRIQQAALFLAENGRRTLIHLSIARALLSETPIENRNDRLFEILTHFNAALAHLDSPEERRQVALLNLQAGQKAKAAAALHAASEYLAAARSLLAADAWLADYRLSFDVAIEAAECVYLAGNFAAADGMLEALMAHARGELDQAWVYRLRLSLYTTQGEMNKAIDAGLDALEILGWHLPRVPSAEQIQASYDEVWDALKVRPIESLIDLTPMTNERSLAALRILAGILLPSHFVGGGVNRLATAKMITLSIRHGITADSVHALSWFAATQVDRSIGRYQEAYRLGKLSYDLAKKHNINSCLSKVCLFFGDIVRFYSKPLKGDRAFLREGFDAGVASGDWPTACYHCNHLITNMLASGEPLDQVWSESERGLEFVRRAKDPNIEKIILSQQRFILNLQGKTFGRLTFSDSELSEAQFEEHLQVGEMMLAKFWYYVLKMSARFIYGDFTGALEAARRAEEFADSDPFDTESTQYIFYSALALAAGATPADEAVMEAIARRREQLRVWSENCPANFENRYFLVCAEEARLRGETLEALRYYERAIRAAEQDGFVQNMAVACERAAEFHRSQGLMSTAQALFERALDGYRRWGAAGKVAALEKRFAKQGKPVLPAEMPGEGGGGTRPSFSSLVDLSAVIKAQRAISSEVVPENLHRRFLEIVLESAGAQRGALILFRDDQPTIEMEFDGEKFNILSMPLEGSSLVPQTLVQYVIRLRTRVVLGDASKPNMFSNEDYFHAHRPMSVLCMPVLRQTRLLAVIYLENNLTTQSFTDECLDLLEMIGSQAAISLENAYLYDDMRASIKARDEFMAIASHELKSPLSSVGLLVQTLKLILQRGKLADYPQAKLLGLLDNSSDSIRHLAALIDQLLDVSRFTLGRLTLNREALDLSAQVRECARLYGREFANARCQLELELGENIIGEWDRLRLQQLIGNLLSNAIKYGAGKPVTVRTLVKDGSAWLTVSDQGIGISQHDLKRLFQPFERAVPYRSISGFGLGLYIVKRVVEAHQGHLDLQSELGHGTTFDIELPLRAT